MKREIMSVVMLLAVSAAIFQGYAEAPASAEQHTPGEINYQGRLVKPDGSLVPDGAYTLDIRLYRVATSGSAIWGGRYATYVKDGYFNLMLGGAAGSDVSPTPTYLHNELWRALWPDPTINSDQKNTLFLEVTPISAPASHGLTLGSALNPRQNLLAAPYAFRAQTAEYANQSIGDFTVNGAFSARYEPLSPFAFRTYKSGTAPFVDIGGNNTGETKLRSATTRVTSNQLIVSSPTQSFSAGAGGFTVNSGAGNVSVGGNNATIDMDGNVTIKGAGSLGTMIGSTSKPLEIMGNSIFGRGPLVWNRPNASTAKESPFIIKEYPLTVPSGQSTWYFDLGFKVQGYSAMVVGWNTGTGYTTHALQPLYEDPISTSNWQLRIRRSPSTGSAVYNVTILFVNKHLVDDQRAAWPGEG
jgi:hypothetical protein